LRSRRRKDQEVIRVTDVREHLAGIDANTPSCNSTFPSSNGCLKASIEEEWAKYIPLLNSTLDREVV